MGEGMDIDTSEGRVVATTCRGCLTNCSVLVHARGEEVVGIEGNPASSANRGRVCSNAKLSVLDSLDPDRITTPLRRRNPIKGRYEEPHFEPISWDEAIDEIADRLMDLRTRGESHRLIVAKGRSTGISGLLNEAFPSIFGTPNRVTHDSICAEAEKLSTGCLDGVWDYHDYDLENAQFVICWGTDPLSSNRMKTFATSALAKVKCRGSLVVVDPRESVTARFASMRLPVVPGTDGALALAMAHIILREGLWNRTFVGDFADGINQFSAGKMLDCATCEFVENRTKGLVTWWNEVVCFCDEAWAAGICGVEEEKIRIVARAFAQASPHAVSWVSTGVAMQARGLYGSMAAYALNGLVGSLGAVGGVLRFPPIPLAPLPSTDPYLDDTARRGLVMPPIDGRKSLEFLSGKQGKAHANQPVNRIADAILAEDPYPIEMMICCWCNFPFSCTGAQRWYDALAKLPFLVDISTHISETGWFADIVLPARSHLLESWGIANGRQNRHSTVSIEQPCVNPLEGTRSDETGVPLLIAKALAERGFTELLDYYEHEFANPETGEPPADEDALAINAVRARVSPLLDDMRSADTARETKKAGALLEETSDAWRRFREQGVWNSESSSFGIEGGFATPSGKFEFESGALKKMIAEHGAAFGLTNDEVLAALGYEAKGEQAFLPHYEPPLRLGDAQEYPFVFTQYKGFANLEGRSANLPEYYKLKGRDPGDEADDDVIKINPVDMARLGIETGDTVRVSSVAGSIVVHAKSWKGVLPGVVAKCYGQGHWAYGTVAAADFAHGVMRGGNNNELIAAEWERISGATARNGGLMRVKVEKIPTGSEAETDGKIQR